jgi:hypothetical protein
VSDEYARPTRTAFGVFYPKEHVMAALPDLERAEAARVALSEAKYSAEVYAGDWVVARYAEFVKQRGVGERLGALLAQDEAQAMKSYVEAAGNSAAIVLVPTQSGSDAELEQIRSHLALQGGRLIRYYGPTFFRDLG